MTESDDTTPMPGGTTAGSSPILLLARMLEASYREHDRLYSTPEEARPGNQLEGWEKKAWTRSQHLEELITILPATRLDEVAVQLTLGAAAAGRVVDELAGTIESGAKDLDGALEDAENTHRAIWSAAAVAIRLSGLDLDAVGLGGYLRNGPWDLHLDRPHPFAEDLARTVAVEETAAGAHAPIRTVLSMAKEWMQLGRGISLTRDGDISPAGGIASERQDNILREMAEVPASSVDGLAVKLMLAWPAITEPSVTPDALRPPQSRTSQGQLDAGKALLWGAVQDARAMASADVRSMFSIEGDEPRAELSMGQSEASAFDAAVAAFEAAGAHLPAEPTEAMVQAGAAAAGVKPNTARRIWEAMAKTFLGARPGEAGA